MISVPRDLFVEYLLDEERRVSPVFLLAPHHVAQIRLEGGVAEDK